MALAILTIARYCPGMTKGLALVLIVVAAAATLAGCSKCDGWWGDRYDPDWVLVELTLNPPLMKPRKPPLFVTVTFVSFFHVPVLDVVVPSVCEVPYSTVLEVPGGAYSTVST